MLVRSVEFTAPGYVAEFELTNPSPGPRFWCEALKILNLTFCNWSSEETTLVGLNSGHCVLFANMCKFSMNEGP